MKRSTQDRVGELLEGDADEALAYVSELLAAGSDDPDLLGWRAECLGELGRFEDAAGAWAVYLRDDPDYLTAYVERARLFVEMGKMQAADSEIRAALELFGERGELLFQRGFWLDVDGSFEAADRAYAAAVDEEELLEVPPRLPIRDVETAMRGLLGPGLQVTIAAMPQHASDAGFGRLCERVGGGIVVYQRNVEREMFASASVQAFVEAVQGALDDLGRSDALESSGDPLADADT